MARGDDLQVDGQVMDGRQPVGGTVRVGGGWPTGGEGAMGSSRMSEQAVSKLEGGRD